MSFRTDDPERDFERYDAEQEAELEKMPVCSYCCQPIQDEKLCEIEGTLYCMECFEENFIKDVEDYVGQTNL